MIDGPFDGQVSAGSLTVSTVDVDGDCLVKLVFTAGSKQMVLQVRREDLQHVLKGPSTWVEKRLVELACAEISDGAPAFHGKPERWHDSPTWRCSNNHVSISFIKTENGGACHACREPIYLTFPEDKDGPLF